MIQLRQLFGALRAFLPDVGVARARRAGSCASSSRRTRRSRSGTCSCSWSTPTSSARGSAGCCSPRRSRSATATGCPAWLETQKEENLAYYARFGFAVVHEHHPVADGPSMWSLSRDPKRR